MHDKKPELLTIQDVMYQLSLSRSSIYALFKSGSLKFIKIGTNVRVHSSELARFLESLGVME